MSPIRISFLLLIALMGCSVVLGQRGGGRGRGNGGFGGGYGGGYGGGRGAYMNIGFGGGRGGGRRYRSTLYNDDEVYGYEANYPGGEALYVNYRNSEARAKRAEEFARSNPYSTSGSFKSGGGQQGQQGYPQQGGRDERNAEIGGMW